MNKKIELPTINFDKHDVKKKVLIGTGIIAAVVIAYKAGGDAAIKSIPNGAFLWDGKAYVDFSGELSSIVSKALSTQGLI